MEWGRRGGGAHHLEARGRLQRVDRRGRLSGVILSIWRIESEQAREGLALRAADGAPIMSEGYKVRGVTPRRRSLFLEPPLSARPVPRVAARDGPARLQHFPCDVPCPGPPGL